jgi:hypothetical protein
VRVASTVTYVPSSCERCLAPWTMCHDIMGGMAEAVKNKNRWKALTLFTSPHESPENLAAKFKPGDCRNRLTEDLTKCLHVGRLDSDVWRCSWCLMLKAAAVQAPLVLRWKPVMLQVRSDLVAPARVRS